MKINNSSLIGIVFCFASNYLVAQEPIVFNMRTVIERYALNSIEAQNAALDYKNQIFDDQNTRKEFLPTLSFSLSPLNFNRSIRSLQSPNDGSYSYVEDYSNSSSTGLSVSQKVPYVNGTFSVSSSLNMLAEFSNDFYSFSSTPYRFSYQQQLFGQYKTYRWEQQVNRLKRIKIVKEYVQALSSIQEKASQLYLNLYVCKRSLEYAEYQCLTSDSLLKISKIRFEQGNMLEKDYLTLELQNTNQHLLMEEESHNYSNAMDEMLALLSIHSEDPSFEVDPPNGEMPLSIQVADVQMKIQIYSPDPENRMISDIEAEQTVYKARMDQWMNANINMNYGTNQYGTSLYNVYHNPLSQQSVTVGLQIPLFNWGIGRNKVIIAKNEYQQTKNNLNKKKEEQERTLKKDVEQYNYLIETMAMAKKSYELSQKNFELTLFELKHQRATVDKLVEIETAMKQSFIQYLRKLSSVWNQYFSIRSNCLYDYIEDKPLVDIFQDQIINWK